MARRSWSAFAGRETGRLDRQSHRLLLEERHAQRLFQHAADGLVGKIHRLLVVAAAEIGMDHVTLDGTGADDGHFDYQVVKTFRLASRGSMLIWARLSIWKTPIVSARRIMA